MKRYVPSGRVAPLALPALLVAGSIAAVAGGWLYQWLISVIPFIYVNFLLTIGFGALLMFVTAFVLTVLPTRNVPVAMAGGAVVGLLGVAASFYFAHGDYQDEVRKDLRSFAATQMEEAKAAGEEVTMPALMCALEEANPEPFTFSSFIEYRVEYGWGVGRGEGVTFSGIMVYILWLIEAGMIAGIASFGGLMIAADPYCEDCGVWMANNPVGALSQLSVNEARSVARSGSLTDLFEVRGKKSRAATAVFKLSECGGETCPRWLTVDVNWTEGRGSESESKSETVVRHMHVSDEELDELLYRIEERQHADDSPRRI